MMTSRGLQCLAPMRASPVQAHYLTTATVWQCTLTQTTRRTAAVVLIPASTSPGQRTAFSPQPTSSDLPLGQAPMAVIIIITGGDGNIAHVRSTALAIRRQTPTSVVMVCTAIVYGRSRHRVNINRQEWSTNDAELIRCLKEQLSSRYWVCCLLVRFLGKELGLVSVWKCPSFEWSKNFK